MDYDAIPEGVGFEPTVTFLPRSISSRVPSTGLSHPSLLTINHLAVDIGQLSKQAFCLLQSKLL